MAFFNPHPIAQRLWLDRGDLRIHPALLDAFGNGVVQCPNEQTENPLVAGEAVYLNHAWHAADAADSDYLLWPVLCIPVF